MPDPVNIVIQNIVYRTPILNEEMDFLAHQIRDKKVEIAGYNDQLKVANGELNVLQRQYMSMYITIRGGFPPENP